MFGARLVTDIATMSVVLSQTQRFWIETSRQRPGMPAPLRHRAERHCLFVLLREGLQAGDVRVERKLAVANRKRRKRVELMQ